MAERVFYPAEQEAFARLSGDYNPIHMDELLARRLLFGAPVVHGVHAMLWCLDALCPSFDESELELLSLKAVFSKPIVVGENVCMQQSAARLAPESEAHVRAKLFVNGTAVASISAKFREAAIRTAYVAQPEQSFPRKIASHALNDAQLSTMSGSLPLHLPIVAAADLFPTLVRRLPAMQIATILATTRVVGVYCPGLNSVFSELELSWAENTANCVEYCVSSFDDRFGLATIDLVAPRMTGQLGAFRRPAPRQQRGYAEFLTLVEPQEFAGCRALLVGGSRGLGEVAAKILCAGGAEVRLTYHRGAQDANNIVADITASGGMASAFQFDISESVLPDVLVSDGEWIPTHALHFATPPILSGSKDVFSQQLFNRFGDYYIRAFNRIFVQLNAIGTKRFLLPSTCYIDEMPPAMAEYIAAKAAAEEAARILEKSNKGVAIAQPRLPRLATDQTATIAGSEDGDPVPVLLDELRRFVGTVSRE